MLCSCGEQSRDSGPIVDLEKTIQDYAWRELKRDARWYQGPLLRRSCYDIEVPWNFYEFEHQTVRFAPRHNRHTVGDGFRERKHVELFSTDYKNNTGKDQIYNLKTQRQTKALTNVTFQRGFNIKGKANFKLKIPERYGHCGVTASADGHLRVTKCRGETLDEMFTWQVDSDITVDPYHVTKVTLVVTEDEFIADFEVRTTMKLTTGEAPIILKRKRDNHIHAVLLISDLGEIFGDLGCPVINVLKGDEGDKQSCAIEIITTGVLESLRWRDQRISIESRPIGPSESEPYDNHYDVPMYSKDIYSRVIKHATQDDDLPVLDRDKINDSTVGVKTETRDLRFKIIPKIVTESPDEVFTKDGESARSETLTSPVYPTVRIADKVEPGDHADRANKVDHPSSRERVLERSEKVQERDNSREFEYVRRPFEIPPPKRPDPVPPYKLTFEKPLKVIRELSLEDKKSQADDDSDKLGTPDSSDSQKFSKEMQQPCGRAWDVSV
ncbi:uncharacterized protein LOC132550419 [Ylistrum balloti]|uniref:uncharacterized protein LOC132550419 n=1 Tax=Ylistrum balloti TaxID=509963 RepID=UPI002905B299|nr:uncharacterized protein LOC132550419 [Ylistrum balloti]